MAVKRRKESKKRKNPGIRSMTGFGKGNAEGSYGTIKVEIKTLNHKQLSIGCTPVEGIFLLEERLKDILGKKIARGKVSVRVHQENGKKKKSLKKVMVNESLAKEYLRKIKALQKSLSLRGEVSIRTILEIPGILELRGENKEEKLWPTIKKAAEKALDSLMDYREKEGARLASDIFKRIQKIRQAVKEIKKYERKSVLDFRKGSPMLQARRRWTERNSKKRWLCSREIAT